MNINSTFVHSTYTKYIRTHLLELLEESLGLTHFGCGLLQHHCISELLFGYRGDLALEADDLDK
jgi:hypothetical protein